MRYGTNLCVGSLRVTGLHEVKGLILPSSQHPLPSLKCGAKGWCPAPAPKMPNALAVPVNAGRSSRTQGGRKGGWIVTYPPHLITCLKMYLNY